MEEKKKGKVCIGGVFRHVFLLAYCQLHVRKLIGHEYLQTLNYGLVCYFCC